MFSEIIHCVLFVVHLILKHGKNAFISFRATDCIREWIVVLKQLNTKSTTALRNIKYSLST